MLHLFGWNNNGDRLDVPVVVNRLLAAGADAYRIQVPSGQAEAGDYLIDISAELAEALQHRGFMIEPWNRNLPNEVTRLKPVRIAVLAGEASAYPYYGYYALALSRLGYGYRQVTGADIAAGALETENLLVLPGGFSNWSIDAKEQSQGADMAVRRFFQEGGAAVVSCGGAYYLSKGRSTWLGVADARPNITQDYLRTGVGMVTCHLSDGYQRLGLPPTLELPYFHGPAFDAIGQDCEALGTFRDLNATGRLFIDNPLTQDKFDALLSGRIAILKTAGVRGRAMLFSPHPEMGDLLAKYMTLEGYIPKYQPIRGDLVMRETIDAYRPEESRSFLMILNAIEAMASAAKPGITAPTGSVDPETATAQLQALTAAWRRKADGIVHTEGALGALEHHILLGLTRRLPPACEKLAEILPATSITGNEGERLIEALQAITGHALDAWRHPVFRRPAETLLELELALLLIESWERLCDMHNLCSRYA